MHIWDTLFKVITEPIVETSINVKDIIDAYKAGIPVRKRCVNHLVSCKNKALFQKREYHHVWESSFNTLIKINLNINRKKFIIIQLFWTSKTYKMDISKIAVYINGLNTLNIFPSSMI